VDKSFEGAETFFVLLQSFRSSRNRFREIESIWMMKLFDDESTKEL